jgi:heptosyltransferase-3
MVDDPVPLAELRRALVIKLRHHGDVLLASPVFTVLKNHAPQLEIDALVYADTAPMLTLHPAISRVHTIDRGWKQLPPLAQAWHEWGLAAGLRARRYELIVHLTEHPRGAWLAQLLRPRYAVALRRAGAGRLWRSSFSHHYGQPSNPRRHTVERNLDALRRLGVHPGEDERRLTLVPGPEAEARVDALLAQRGLAAHGFVHLHPTSRWLFKCWPMERVAALVRELAAGGEAVALTAAPDVRERDMVAEILAAAPGRLVDLAGQLSLKEMAALSARAKLFVGVDSAPMHIAAAVGTPVIALFGPSGELEWGPWQVAARVIASDAHPCRPCGIDGCGGGKRSECLTTLPVQRVIEAAQSLLATPTTYPVRSFR